MKKKKALKTDDSAHKNKPIRLPLDFGRAVEGLLRVTPGKKKSEPKAPVKKKARRKK